MKAEFLTDLYVELKPGRDDDIFGMDDDIWVLTKPLVYNSKLLNKQVTVPAGFETDLASVPRIPVVFWFWGGRAHREAILHDAFYRSDFPTEISFSMGNLVFLEAMKSRGKPWNIRYPIYLGVCVGGYFSYHKRLMGDSL